MLMSQRTPFFDMGADINNNLTIICGLPTRPSCVSVCKIDPRMIAFAESA